MCIYIYIYIYKEGNRKAVNRANVNYIPNIYQTYRFGFQLFLGAKTELYRNPIP